MILNLFGSKTVASITASLSVMVEELRAHAAGKLEEMEKHLASIVKFQALHDDANVEVVKARSAADKIAGLLG